MFEHIDPRVYKLVESISALSVWLMIFVVIFVPLEMLFAVHPKKFWRKQVGIDLCYYFLSSLVPAAILSVPAGMLAWVAHNFTPSQILAMTGSMPLWAQVLAGFVAGEIGYYWGHRLSHEIPFLWDYHCIHHSAEEVDFLVNSRSHPVDMVFGRFCGLIPMYALGLATPMTADGTLVPVLVTVFGNTWGFFVHANLRWRFGPLEWLISTPAFHHWHHTKSGPINHNYASTLPWLDRLFGTHHLPNQWPEDYGIKANLPDSLLGQLAYPFVAPPAVANSAAPSEESVTNSTLYAEPLAVVEHSEAAESSERVDLVPVGGGPNMQNDMMLKINEVPAEWHGVAT